MTEAYGMLPETEPDWGKLFSYAQWTAGTKISLHNVPWDAAYRDIVKFESMADLDEYLTTDGVFGHEIENMSYAKVGDTVRLPLPFNACYQYNYLRVHNPRQPHFGDTPATFYYFIKDVIYLSPETTELVIQLDVWQSFGWYAEFGRCYIERGHIGIANKNQFSNFGRDFLTVPEGLDIGNEMYVHNTYEHHIAKRGDYHIFVWSTVDLTEYWGTATNPNLKMANRTNFEGLPNGLSCIWFRDLAEFGKMADAMARYPWISQGVVSIMAVPPFDIDSLQYSDHYRTIDGVTIRFRTFRDTATEKVPNILTNMKENWRNDIEKDINREAGGRYDHLKKLLVYPYCVVELTTYTGTPIVLKPENMTEADLKVVRLNHYALPNPRVVFIPWRYNARSGHPNGSWDPMKDDHDHAEFLDLSTGIMNFPTFSLANNSYLAYLASNANQIAYQYREADWTQNKALTANQLGYDQASAQMDLAGAINQLNVGANTAQMNVNNDATMLRGAIGAGHDLLSWFGGNNAVSAITGAASNIANTAVSVNQNTALTGIQNRLSSGITGKQLGTSGYMRDTNKAYADFAAKGDYGMAIGAIKAKVQDAKLLQPTTSGQVGGDAFNLAAFRWSLFAKVKRIQPGMMVSIAEYWLRYGYAIDRFTVPPADLQCMTHFTYWKMREVYITSGPMPEPFKQTIRGIFEKGVTVWRRPEVIGFVDPGNNKPLEGIEL